MHNYCNKTKKCCPQTFKLMRNLSDGEEVPVEISDLFKALHVKIQHHGGCSTSMQSAKLLLYCYFDMQSYAEQKGGGISRASVSGQATNCRRRRSYSRVSKRQQSRLMFHFTRRLSWQQWTSWHTLPLNTSAVI